MAQATPSKTPGPPRDEHQRHGETGSIEEHLKALLAEARKRGCDLSKWSADRWPPK